MNVLATERLQLRHLNPGDAAFMLELLNEPSYIRHIGDKGVRTLAESGAFIEQKLVASYQQNGFGLYLVELKQSTERLGICGLVKRDGLKDIDIGFAFLQRFWSKGYAYEAASAVMDYAQATVGLKRIVAITAPDNWSSIGLLQKLGLRYDKSVLLPGHQGESKLFVKPFAEVRRQ